MSHPTLTPPCDASRRLAETAKRNEIRCRRLHRLPIGAHGKESTVEFVRGLCSAGRCGPDRGSGIVEHQASFVEHEFAAEVQRWRGVVVPLSPGAAIETNVALLKTLDVEAQRSDVRSGRVRRIAGLEAEPVHRKSIGQGRGLEVDVEASVEVRRGATVQKPLTTAIALEYH